MTPRIALIVAVVAWAGVAQAQLPGLPGVGLPPASAPLPTPAPRIPTAPRLPRDAPPVMPNLPPLPASLPNVTAAPLGPLSRDLSAGLAADANAALGLPGLIDETVLAVEETTGSYRERARELLRRHGRTLEADAEGRPVVRGEVIGIGVAPAVLARAKGAGFRIRSQETIAGLDIATAVLAPPRGLSAREGLARLRALDPAGRYELNHIYVESGGGGAPGAGAASAAPSGRGLRIGLVDGTALRTHPALAGAPMVQQAFARGGARVSAHATAVASLLVGSGPGFRGAAPGATLYVADVYGSTPAGGSALSVARALGWLAQSRTAVIDISLVGPPNALLEAAVAAVTARGHVVVAAVGNDGPAAGPLYPAAYPGVVAVTAVDARRRVLPEAGRGAQVAFAAPGADMLAAGLGGGLVGVRGTSYAAPLAAGRLARLLPQADPAGARRAVATLAREAADMGAPGRDPVFGRGLVAFDLAVRPAAVTAAR
jgi:hypothetical protein